MLTPLGVSDARYWFACGQLDIAFLALRHVFGDAAAGRMIVCRLMAEKRGQTGQRVILRAEETQ